MPFVINDKQPQNPSLLDGVPPELFWNARLQAVRLIFGASERLDLPLCVPARAALLFQEFYEKRSLLKNDCFLVTLACLYVATKVEGRQKNVKDIILTCFEVRFEKGEHPLKDQRNRAETLDFIVKMVQQVEEVLLLEITQFQFADINVYGHALNLLSHVMDTRDDTYYRMQQLTCNLINDSMYTPLCLMYPGEDVARGLVQTALRLARMESLLERNVDVIWEGKEHIRSEISKAVTEMMTGLYDFTNPAANGS